MVIAGARLRRPCAAASGARNVLRQDAGAPGVRTGSWSKCSATLARAMVPEDEEQRRRRAAGRGRWSVSATALDSKADDDLSASTAMQQRLYWSGS